MNHQQNSKYIQYSYTIQKAFKWNLIVKIQDTDATFCEETKFSIEMLEMFGIDMKSRLTDRSRMAKGSRQLAPSLPKYAYWRRIMIPE